MTVATQDVVEESFGFADEDLAGLCDRLSEEGVDVQSLLTELAGIDPDRLMRRYRAMTIRKQSIAEQAAEERSRLDAWVQAKTQGLDRQLEFLGGQLVTAARELAKRTHGKVKKLDTPWGHVQLRKQPASLVVEDAEKALGALTDEQFIRVTRSIDKAALKKAMLAGEVGDIPGVTLEQPDEDKATISPDVPKVKADADAPRPTDK